MATEVSICNLALSSLGHTESISSLTEGSAAAIECNRWYAVCRDAVLEDFAWPFAEKFLVLASLGSPPTEWLYRYSFPSDCINPLYIVNPDNAATGRCITSSSDTFSDFYVRKKKEIPYKVSGQDNVSRVILTDEEDATLCYTQKITNTNLFSPLFVMALSHLLASKLAIPLPISSDLAQLNFQQYQLTISQAWASAMNAEEKNATPDSEHVKARLG